MLIALALCLAAPRAQAEATAEETARAAAARATANALLAAGDYPGALAKFQVAYALGKQSSDLLEAAKCRLKLGDRAAAKAGLFQFLATDPKSERAPEAFALIAEIDEDDKPQQAVARPLGTGRKIALGTGALALIAGGVGGVFGLQAHSTASEIHGAAHSREQVLQLQSQLDSRAARANACFVAAGVLAAVTTALFVINF